MDPTLQASLAALIGVVVGAVGVMAWHVSDRLQHRELTPEPPVLPAGVATVLSTLRSSGVVVDEHDTVLKASAPAYALGLVRGNELVIAELADLVRQVRRDGQIRESEMTLERELAPPIMVNARVAPLGSRLVLALLEDRTRERRVEAVRRDFVANVSHELKTPVGAIKILAEAVEDASDDPEAVRRFASRMRVESDRLASLVQQVIELSRLQAVDLVETRSEVRIDQVVAEAVDTSALDAASKGISLVVRGDTGLSVSGDPKLVAAAVSNLVSNAVAYSGERTSVVVETKGLERTVEISVVDQGIGIPTDEIDRIFERFYRVDPARHRSTGGTGLGLSIVKHVAATHGGDVRVWSVQGQGSTFTLVLPRHVNADSGIITAEAPTVGDQQEGTIS
ncbi:sensor histidine kinase [Nocardioides daphniae]|uniref:Sensor-like histidine kinase SenX3 n=1 Tax=Nocardioides daphniae TaxID=402297 RepID=A0A4V1CW98_9ACTN|nr:ATP-binding protein [Nocardioides daphniae]QCC76517.1 two-component sensor histidine kinase [Nocardioides daphniae]GGD05912.1 two-component sensor histidine kinase [Nocardioides daphniae]